ncbi:hypothetical protein L6164_002585 [Bauhinia variegata]|uniref:Uncharacterized protein n=1 Tax=Bauhinia variegata TaxID=167791 RepID=A0ACB9PYS4_BAUVA|nr:hypothetical protein L6164_002585 [Bauhinia variegata]
MPTMSATTWQLSSGDGNNFRWEDSDLCVDLKPDDSSNVTNFHSPSSTSCLPSMADLLLQGCSKFKNNHNEGENGPMFRTGLGKSVAVKQSSMVRAVSVLGLDATVGAGERNAIDKGFGFSNSLFQTGSGKMVNISSDGLARAKALLGFEEDTTGCNSQSLQHKTKMHNIDEAYERQCSPHLQSQKGVNSYRMRNVLPCPSSTLKNDAEVHIIQQQRYNSACNKTPIKFHTAGGRSLSVSSDALNRARSLLGDPDLDGFFNDGDTGDLVFFLPNGGQTENTTSGQGSNPNTPLFNQVKTKSKHVMKGFTSPLQSSSPMQFSAKFASVSAGSNLIKKFDAADKEGDATLNSSITSQQKPSNESNPPSDATVCNSPSNSFSSKIDPQGKSSGRPLVDISNTINTENTYNRQPVNMKRTLGNRVTVSPFKRPRNSKFSAPLNNDASVFPNGLSKLSSGNAGRKQKVSTRYPFQYQRMYMMEFLGMPPLKQEKWKHLPDQVRRITPKNAEKYVLHDGSSLNIMGPESFFHLLAQYGTSTRFASQEWVKNHYKWIVWKLASYERCYPDRFAGKLLTVLNVLEELKYRYEREVNHGHRSAIKKILEGDALSSSMMILCISAIHSDCCLETATSPLTLTGAQSNEAIKVELTDGWYAMTAILDVPLSKQLAAGKLFVGQKLRIWGSGLHSWIGPVSPLEVSPTVSLLLHINGTYRVDWAQRLGFCKNAGPPLAFRCIKSNGGLVPRTLARISRIYPILYKERLSSGGSVVRSERMESRMRELYDQRCSAVVEGIISEFQKERKRSHAYDDSDSEGAKIYKMLETAADPEFLMADMSLEELSSFAAYKEKIQATRQSDMEKAIEKALKDAGLGDREVTPFLRVRVVGLTHKTCQADDRPKEGLVTIWNPKEMQQEELVEGQAYVISGLVPSGSDSDILCLQAKGPTKWLPLSFNSSEQFKPLLSHRKSTSLTSLQAIPLSNEFDIAAFVVHVGEPYTSGQQKKQWIFVTDGSVSGLQSEKLNSLLAISFCSPSIDYDSFPPINYNLAGSTVAFCNLTKKAKDDKSHIWVAEATENSTYYLNFDSPNCSHLKHDATSIQRWANMSSSTINQIRDKVLSITGNCKG